MSILDTFYILFESQGAEKVKKSQDEATASAEKTGEALKETGEKGKLAAKEIEEGNSRLAESFDKVKEHAAEMSARLIEHAMEVAAAFAALFAVERLVDGVFETAEQSDQLGERAKSLGIEVSELDAWGNAVKRVGGTAEAFGASLVNVNRSISRFEVTGKGRILPFLKELGLSTDTLKMKFGELLPALAKATEGRDKQQTAGALRGLGFDEGTIRLLQRGKEGVDALIARQRELGNVTEEDAETAEKFNIEWDDIKQLFHELTVQFDTYFLPSLQKILEEIEAITEYLRDHKNLVVGFFIALAAAAIYAADTFGLLDLLLSPVILIVAAIVALSAAFAIAYEDIVAFSKGNKSLIGDLSKQWPIVGEAVKGVIWLFRELKDVAIETILAIANWIKKIPQGLEEWANIFAYIGQVIVGFGQYVLSVFEELFPSIANYFAMVGANISHNVNWWKDAFISAFDAIRLSIQIFWDWVKATFGLAANLVIDPIHAFQKFGEAVKGIFAQLGTAGEDLINLFQKIGNIITTVTSKISGVFAGLTPGALAADIRSTGSYVHRVFAGGGSDMMPDLAAAQGSLASAILPIASQTSGSILASSGKTINNTVTVAGSTINAQSSKPEDITSAFDAHMNNHVQSAINQLGSDGVSH